MRAKKIGKIFGWFAGVIILLAGALFAIGYFYYAGIIRNYLIETVSRESKGLYKAEIGSLSLNLLAGNLTIDQFSLLPDTALYRKQSLTDTLSPLLIKLTINQFRIRDFRVMEALRQRKIDMTPYPVYRARNHHLPNEDASKNK